MKINPSTILFDVYGKAIKDRPGEGAEDLTLGGVCVFALLASLQIDQNQGVQDHLKRHRLAQKLAAGDEVDLTAEDVALLKGRVASCQPTLVVGPVCDLLDPESVSDVKTNSRGNVKQRHSGSGHNIVNA